ncbi:hypothetical protein ACVWW1_000169 [Bradyrhizobium sp. JR3.5]
MALLSARNAAPGTWRAHLLVVGLVGAALLYGDGAITPAISALSAIEGLKVDAPSLSSAVVPLTLDLLDLECDFGRREDLFSEQDTGERHDPALVVGQLRHHPFRPAPPY